MCLISVINTMPLRQSWLMVVASRSVSSHLQRARCCRCTRIVKMDWAHMIRGFIACVSKVGRAKADPRVDFGHMLSSGRALLVKRDANGCKRTSAKALRDMNQKKGHCALQMGVNVEVCHMASGTSGRVHHQAKVTNVRIDHRAQRGECELSWVRLEPT